uniref:Uncharacterized protein n=1 Tax=Rhizophora mucronata TaxID=61149 RepID=A0A2P2L8A4_RHIMU
MDIGLKTFVRNKEVQETRGMKHQEWETGSLFVLY